MNFTFCFGYLSIICFNIIIKFFIIIDLSENLLLCKSHQDYAKKGENLFIRLSAEKK